MNLCPWAANCRRAELCQSPHPEPTERACLDPIAPNWEWPMLARAQSQAAPLGDDLAAMLAPIPSPEVDRELLARVDAVLAEMELEPEDKAGKRPEGEPAEGELF